MKFARRRNRAGASAKQMARRSSASRNHRIALALPVTGVASIAIGFLVTQALGVAVGAAAAAAALATGLMQALGSGKNSWSTGAAGERRTARILAPLTWLHRYVVLHDRAIPRSRANLDHLIIGRAGLLYVDTKNWTSTKSQVRLASDGQLWYGRFPQGRAAATVRWEADQAQRVLGWPVRAVIAVHGARVPGGLIQLDGVTVVQARKLRRYIRTLPPAPGWSREMVSETARVADTRLPPAASRSW
ncbi:nuclease-related domain-containing protein [Streptomyces sp. NPDC093589]|uniref:nuclease-related domain-containing protein n=1 Tax=Streptomyces sp. NPDC093589 TaxID=3366043 RepID=UPI003810A293